MNQPRMELSEELSAQFEAFSVLLFEQIPEIRSVGLIINWSPQLSSVMPNMLLRAGPANPSGMVMRLDTLVQLSRALQELGKQGITDVENLYMDANTHARRLVEQAGAEAGQNQ